MLSLQNIRSSGVGQALQNGLTVSWTYAGGATVAAPTTIWSENTGDASNQITVQYNGVSVFLKKRVAAINTWVSLPVVLTAGTYPVQITLNADNTIQLIVNGVAASAGLGAEILSAAQQVYTSGWAVTGQATVATNAARLLWTTSTASSIGTLSNATLVQGHLFEFGYNVSAASGDMRDAVLLHVMPKAIGTNVYSWVHTAGYATYWSFSRVGVCDITLTTASIKEVFNNTSTVAIPWATVL